MRPAHEYVHYDGMPRVQRKAIQLTTETLRSAFGCRPFSLPMAAEAGVSRESVRSAQRHGAIRRLSHGHYVVPSTDTSAEAIDRAHAALAPLGATPAVVTGRLGGDLHRIPFITPRGRSGEIAVSEILVPASARLRCGSRAINAVVRRVEVLPPDIVEVAGIPVTSLVHAAIDMVRMGTRHPSRSRAWSLPLPESLVVLDAATQRLGAQTQEDAASLVNALRGRFRYGPGIRAVDGALEFIDPLAETPLESWSRGYMILYGVPMPISQHVITGSDGMDYRGDFCWPELGVIGEADGLEKYGSTPEEFRLAKSRELERQRALEAAGWIVVRWTWDELARDPAAVMRRILDAMQRRPRGSTRHHIAS